MRKEAKSNAESVDTRKIVRKPIAVKLKINAVGFALS